MFRLLAFFSTNPLILRKFCESHPVQRPRKCNDRVAQRASHPVEFCASHPVQRPRSSAHRAAQRNQSAEVCTSHPVQRPRIAPRKCNQSVEVRASHPVQRPRTARIAQPARSHIAHRSHITHRSHNPPDREPTRSHIASAHRTSRPIANPPDRTSRPRIAHRARATRPPLARSHIAPAHQPARRSHNRPRGMPRPWYLVEYCTQYRQFGGVCVGSYNHRWFRLVRGTNFSKIQYIYIFIFQIFMTHLVYWLECENLY